ncbi:hypothetical protein NUW58_g4601 [Xylaria curta]|uniref:Uncharacterized protein n=1 Tax=Xylaria curta TaxID=42375 RepID=A0ACC1P7A8_9PEZI|nr:hypothetical protein NUW58_g4601 [Xylaria curta]
MTIPYDLIIAGHVAGPAHITGVEDSIIVVAARQVRMHDCKNVHVYLHCASHPIIEDCSQMAFAPLPLFYGNESTTPETNLWDQVDDFKWLKDVASPNWVILAEDRRIADGVWKDTRIATLPVSYAESLNPHPVFWHYSRLPRGTGHASSLLHLVPALHNSQLGANLAQLSQRIPLPRNASLKRGDFSLLLGEPAVEIRQRGLDEVARALEAVL